MSSTAPAPSALAVPDRAVLERARAAVAARRTAEVEVLESALAWAHAHVPAGEDDTACWRADTIPAAGSAAALFGERVVPIAGAGTPLVAEFAVLELAGVLDVSHEAALCLVGDVLDLAHRLPRTWALVRELRVSVQLGREAARVSRDLDVVAAGHADRLLSWRPRGLNPHRVGVLVDEARLYADPDRAVADHDAALAARRVEVHHEEGAPGTSQVWMTLDTADAVAFDSTVSTMAVTMRALGHHGDLGVRRAHAVGVLADPQRALDLLAASDIADPDRRVDPDHDPAVCVAEDIAHGTATPFGGITMRGAPGVTGRGTGGGEAVVVFHVTDRDLLATDVDDAGAGSWLGRGVARSPKLGPVLTARLHSWLLTAGTVTIKPVLDVTAMAAVDQHDPPAAMAEAVRLRDETCVFPRCGRRAEVCDLDHIDEYVPLEEGGPPGQTRPDNLAPLCRRHHRAKTFGAFSYRRLGDGSYEWTLPSGTQVTTDPHTPRPAPPPPRRRRP